MISPWYPRHYAQEKLGKFLVVAPFSPPKKKARRTSPAGSATMPGNDPMLISAWCSLTERRRAGRNATLREKKRRAVGLGELRMGKAMEKTWKTTGWGPQSIAFSCQKKWPNSIVYGRYNELVNGDYFMLINQLITGGPHPAGTWSRTRRKTFSGNPWEWDVHLQYMMTMTMMMIMADDNHVDKRSKKGGCKRYKFAAGERDKFSR